MLITGIGNEDTTTMNTAAFHFGMGLQLQVLRTVDETLDVVDPEEKRVQMITDILNQLGTLKNGTGIV
jgi:hypothetical protein